MKKGTGEESTLGRRRPNISEGENRVEIISTTMLIEVILILGLFLVIPLIIMVIPMEILLIIIIGTPLILRIILKNLSMLKRILILQ